MIFKIKIAKARTALDVEFDELPGDVQQYIVEQGLSKLLNSATAKVTKANEPDETKLAEQALGLANKKLDSLKAGSFKRTTKSDGKVPGVVMTEARRLAKNIVKAGIKAAGQRISDYEAKAITEAANAYLAQHPELIETAKASIEASSSVTSAAAVDIAGIPISAEKVAKNEEKKAKAKAETAAKNAGKPGSQRSAIKHQAKPVVPVRRPPPEQHTAH